MCEMCEEHWDNNFAYNLGRAHGYDAMEPHNPYASGTIQYEDYKEGYDQGHIDCYRGLQYVST